MAEEKIDTIIPKLSAQIFTTCNLYKNCEGRLSEKCHGLDLKEHFRGKLCKICYNIKQLNYAKKKSDEKKQLKLQKIQLHPDQMIKLSQIVNREQLSKILDAEQMEKIVTLLELSKISENSNLDDATKNS